MTKQQQIASLLFLAVIALVIGVTVCIKCYRSDRIENCILDTQRADADNYGFNVSPTSLTLKHGDQVEFFANGIRVASSDPSKLLTVEQMLQRKQQIRQYCEDLYADR